MGAEAAARLGDEIAHGPGMAAMLAGAVVGAMVGAAIVTAAAIAAPVTAAIVVGGSAAAGALSMKQLVHGFCSVFKLPEPPSGSLMNGSGDVFINGKPAVRAGIDVATPCTGAPLNHPALPVPVLVAEGSANVFINGRPVARLKDKLVCGAHISGGSDNVFIGGGTQGTGHSVINIEEWTETAFEWLGLAALVGAGALAASAGVGALAIFGATALGINEALIGLGKLGDRLGPGYGDLLQGTGGLALLLAGPKGAKRKLDFDSDSIRSSQDKTSHTSAEELPQTQNTSRTVLSGHGSYEEGEFVMPEGTSVTLYSKHGAMISDRLGNVIETGGDLSGVYKETYGPGESMPDYTLHPPGDLNIAGSPITVSQPTRLSMLVNAGMGDVHWAACTYCSNEDASNLMFDTEGVVNIDTNELMDIYSKGSQL